MFHPLANGATHHQLAEPLVNELLPRAAARPAALRGLVGLHVSLPVTIEERWVTAAIGVVERRQLAPARLDLRGRGVGRQAQHLERAHLTPPAGLAPRR